MTRQQTQKNIFDCVRVQTPLIPITGVPSRQHVVEQSSTIACSCECANRNVSVGIYGNSFIRTKESIWITLNLKPLGDRVIIKPSDDDELATPRGIIIPDTAKEKPQRGAVIAAGPGRTTDDGNIIEMAVKIGQTVVYSKYAGSEYLADGVDYLIVRESDILATVG
jgi:chaperonin GroES